MQPFSWIRDFGMMGAGIGGLAPLVALVPMSMGPSAQPLYLLAVGISLGGLVAGLVVGGLLQMCWVAMPERPLLLSPIGFPIGAAAGAVVGCMTGSVLHTQAIPIVGVLGMITGGLVLGLTWLPYLALRASDRSGVPVILSAVVLSPVVGILALGSTFALGF